MNTRHVLARTLGVAAVILLARPTPAETPPAPLGSLVVDGTPMAVSVSLAECGSKRIDLKFKNNGSEAAQIRFTVASKEGTFVFEQSGMLTASQFDIDPGELRELGLRWSPSGAAASATATVTLYSKYAANAIAREWKRIDMVEGATVKRLEKQLDHAKKLGPDTSPIDIREAKARQSFKKSDEERAKTCKTLSDTVVDLMSGYYCSACGKTKAQFEAEGKSFEKHLGDVGAKAVPAPPETIAKAKAARDQCTKNRAKAKVDFDASLVQFDADRKKAQQDHDAHKKQLETDLATARKKLEAAEDRVQKLAKLEKSSRIDVSAACGGKDSP